VPNVRAAADPANPKATVDVDGVTLDQFFSVNLDTSKGDVRDAIKAGLVTQLDDKPYDEDEFVEQVAAIEAYHERVAGTAAAPAEPAAEAEVARAEAHTETQRHRSSRST
jgi:hypothetical protein